MANDDEIPQEVRAFIAEHINSVVEVEMLLLLQVDPSRQWAAEEISQKLRIDARWVQSQLNSLCTRQVLICTEQPDPTYRYAPRNPALERAIAGLMDAYANYRVTVISLIFSKPIEKIRSFADAFVLRKEKPDGR